MKVNDQLHISQVDRQADIPKINFNNIKNYAEIGESVFNSQNKYSVKK